VAAIRIAMTSAVRVATAAGGFGEPALDHDTGGAQEVAEEPVPNHVIIVEQRRVLARKKHITFGPGIYSGKCENRGSERCILRWKVASSAQNTATSMKAKAKADSEHKYQRRDAMGLVPVVRAPEKNSLTRLNHRMSL
jgi:hypothetical protein